LAKIRIQKPSCLSGYKWIFKEDELVLSFENNKPIIYDYKDKYTIEWFDASSVVEKLENKIDTLQTELDTHNAITQI
jgi:hypothetical protein